MSQVDELSEAFNEATAVEVETAAPDPYELIDAMNWSTLKLLHASPAHYQSRIATPIPDKPAFKLGRASHFAVLQPELLEKHFDVYSGKHDARHNAFKAWAAEHPGITPLKQATWDTACRVRDAVHANSDASALLRGGLAEETVLWDVGDIACKARVDYLRPDGTVELKTARDITPRWFFSDMARYLYHGQGAYYHDGAKLGRRITTFAERPFTIAVEVEPPHDVGVFQLSLADYGLGATLVEQLMQRYRDCVATDWWPGKVPTITQTNLPHWTAGSEQEEDFE